MLFPYISKNILVELHKMDDLYSNTGKFHPFSNNYIRESGKQSFQTIINDDTQNGHHNRSQEVAECQQKLIAVEEMAYRFRNDQDGTTVKGIFEERNFGQQSWHLKIFLIQ